MKKILAAISILIVLSSCASPSSLVNKADEKQVEKNVLTNLPGKNGPLLAVKIDDTNAAHPQVGLNSADVIYIEQVEGGLTRLAAIFTDKVPDLIGPVRSARISDIEILEQYGRVGFAYSGAQSKLRPVLAAANLENMSAERNPPSIYQSDKTRFAPTNLMVDAPHKDLRRARSAMLSLAPTTTGSATAIALIYPDLKGKLNGHAVRAPVLNASLTDCVFELQRETTAQEVNELFAKAAQGALAGILGYETRPLVSADYARDTRSSIVDALSTMVTAGTMLKVYAWYDNEMGYACRMIDLACHLEARGL